MSKVVVVTGASSGLGQAIAQHLAAQGHTVFGTARVPFDIQGDVRMIQLDVTDDHSVNRAIDEVIAAAGHIDVLINNAGVAICGAVEDTGLEEVRRQMETNFFGVVRTICAVLPHMRAKGTGRIINISALAGLVGLPYQAFYSASKFAIEALNESLRLELSGSGIDCTNINPAVFKTGMTAARVFARRALIGGNSKQLITTIYKYEHHEMNGGDPAMVARVVERLVNKPRVSIRYFVGRFDQRILMLMKRIIPAGMFERLMKHIYVTL
jgi:NAD(P)-dependent dehydrogenase (short-subunit alcohol dehydrogenase family)